MDLLGGLNPSRTEQPGADLCCLRTGLRSSTSTRSQPCLPFPSRLPIALSASHPPPVPKLLLPASSPPSLDLCTGPIWSAQRTSLWGMWQHRKANKTLCTILTRCLRCASQHLCNTPGLEQWTWHWPRWAL